MGEWKAFKKSSGTGWKELTRESGTGWKALEWESIGLDVGYPLLDNGDTCTAAGYTLISKDNPANMNGEATTFKVYVCSTITGLKIGSFEVISGNTLKCKDVYTVGNLSLGYHEVNISLDFLSGEYIGQYCSAGGIDQFLSGYEGLWYVLGDTITVDNQSDYILAGNNSQSMEGSG